MKFGYSSVSRGNSIIFRNMSLILEGNTDENKHCDTVLGKEFIVGGRVNFQLRVFYYDHKPSSKGPIYKAVHLFVKLQSRDKNAYAVAVSSLSLKVYKYFKIQPVEETVSDWYSVYDQMVCIDTWKFNLIVTLMSNGVNEYTVGWLVARLYEDNDTTDVELVGTDGTVRAHGNVLAAVSPYMRAAFYGKFAEARDKRLDVPDASVAALQLIKKFAYTGYVDAEPVMMVALLPLASLFMMDELHRACASSLTHLKPDEITPMLPLLCSRSIGSRHEEPEQKQKSLLMIENEEKQPNENHERGDGDGDKS